MASELQIDPRALESAVAHLESEGNNTNRWGWIVGSSTDAEGAAHQPHLILSTLRAQPVRGSQRVSSLRESLQDDGAALVLMLPVGIEICGTYFCEGDENAQREIRERASLCEPRSWSKWVSMRIDHGIPKCSWTTPCTCDTSQAVDCTPTVGLADNTLADRVRISAELRVDGCPVLADRLLRDSLLYSEEASIVFGAEAGGTVGDLIVDPDAKPNKGQRVERASVRCKFLLSPRDNKAEISAPTLILKPPRENHSGATHAKCTVDVLCAVAVSTSLATLHTRIVEAAIGQLELLTKIQPASA